MPLVSSRRLQPKGGHNPACNSRVERGEFALVSSMQQVMECIVATKFVTPFGLTSLPRLTVLCCGVHRPNQIVHGANPSQH
eukprot:11314848-Heterocapsa_arctica.AAC.1